MLDSFPAGLAGASTIFEGVSDKGLFTALNALARLPDSTERAVAVARFIASRPRSDPPLDRPAFVKILLTVNLMGRGHLRQAYQALGRNPFAPFAELALLGGMPAESTAVAFRERLSSRSPSSIAAALPWWTAQRDTASLQLAAARADVLARSGSDSIMRPSARYVAASADAYLVLARGDTAGALERFLALPQGACPGCYLDRLTIAQLLADRHRDRDAARLLVGEFPPSTLTPLPSEVLWILLRGRVAERLGDQVRATQSYAWVTGMWRNADPELQPYVSEARDALARLTGEKR
jgi:hypothetical protein